MKSCLRIPRLFLPEEGIAHWCYRPGTPCVEEDKEDPSARSCLCLCEGMPGEEQLSAMRDNMYKALTGETIGRLVRGMVLVKRTTQNGTRAGLLAAADLEEFAPEGSKTAAIRPSCETDPVFVEKLKTVRKNAVFEVPHAVLAYRDKKRKLLRALEGEELETLYDLTLGEGDRLEGYFVPEYLSEELVTELCRYADPCFGILDGHHAFAAAYAHWREVKAAIPAHEARNHPARFALAEFVELNDPAVTLTKDGSPFKKEELVSLWKEGKRYPARSLCLDPPRCHMEAREISYD